MHRHDTVDRHKRHSTLSRSDKRFSKFFMLDCTASQLRRWSREECLSACCLQYAKNGSAMSCRPTTDWITGCYVSCCIIATQVSHTNGSAMSCRPTTDWITLCYVSCCITATQVSHTITAINVGDHLAIYSTVSTTALSCLNGDANL